MYFVQNLNLDLVFRATTVSRIVQIMTNRKDQIKMYQSGPIFKSISADENLKRQKGNAHFQFVPGSSLISGNLGSEHVSRTQNTNAEIS